MVNADWIKSTDSLHGGCCIAESDDQHSVASPEKPESQYAEVQIRQADPDRGDAPRDF